MKLRLKIPLAFAAVSLLMAAFGLLGIYRLHQAIDTYASAVRVDVANEQAAAALLADFRLQVQEWKNTLPRGKDSGQRAKYWSAFQANEAIVSTRARALREALPPGEAKQLVGRFADAHAAMGRAYRQGFEAYVASDADMAVGDAAVKGKDRAPAQLLEQAARTIGASTLAALAAARDGSSDATALSLGLLLAGGIGAIGAGLALAGAIVRPIERAVDAARQVAAGDLRQDAATADQRSKKGGDETASLLAAMQQMTHGLRGLIRQVHAGAASIAGAASEIASGNLDLSRRTEQQAASLEETASSMEQLMASISASARRIVDITGVIDSIAFQTNILALNAAVEAARAGEQGRGFAVVASEVRQLAQRAATAARDIKQLSDDSVAQVDAGSTLVGRAGASMHDIVDSVRRVSDIMAEISSASSEQEAGIGQINLAITEMDSSTQHNAALVEQTAAAAQAMQEQTLALSAVASQFSTGESVAAVAPPARPPRQPARPARVALAQDADQWEQF